MKIIQALFSILFLQPVFSFSQDFWEQLYFPDTADITCLAVNNAGDIFVGTGSNNTVSGLYRSTDGAQTWDLLFNNGNFSIHSIFINTANRIYVTKSGGTKILTSTDNGNTWDTINKPNYISANIGQIVASGVDTLFISSVITSTPILLRSYDNGITWDSVFTTYNGTSEQISDIIINPVTKVIYISLFGFFQNMGGVYKSEDWGNNWEYIGLFNHQLTSLALNSYNDLFVGSFGGWNDTIFGGLNVLRNGSSNWEPLSGWIVYDIVINSEENIFCGVGNGVIFSDDNGETFESINSGLPSSSTINIVAIDSNGFIYLARSLSNFLAKTVETTVDIEESLLEPNPLGIILSPNPFSTTTTLQFNLNTTDLSTVEIKIYDQVGKEVQHIPVKSVVEGMNTVELNMQGLPSGIYYYTLFINGKQIDTKKMVVAR